MEDTININIGFPRKIHTEAKKRSAEMMITLKEYVIKAVDEKNKREMVRK